jgi:molybdopterin converting factor small subunit
MSQDSRRQGRSGEEDIAMPVSIRLPTVLRPHVAGLAAVAVEGATIGEVLSTLVEQNPGLSGQVIAEDGTLNKFVNIYVNDDDVRYLQQLDTPVADGDEVSILPAVAGGTA